MRVLIQLPLLAQFNERCNEDCNHPGVERIFVSHPSEIRYTHCHKEIWRHPKQQQCNAPLTDLVRFLDVVLVVVRLCLGDILQRAQ